MKGLEAMSFRRFVMMIYYLQIEEVKRAKSAREEGASAVATIMFKDSCLTDGGETRRNLAEIIEKSSREIRIGCRSRKSPEPGVTGVFMPAT
jgi:hypothetical protein